jgi:hypothetical protein
MNHDPTRAKVLIPIYATATIAIELIVAFFCGPENTPVNSAFIYFALAKCQTLSTDCAFVRPAFQAS